MYFAIWVNKKQSGPHINRNWFDDDYNKTLRTRNIAKL